MPDAVCGIGDLSGKKGLVLGIANENSLAYGCARTFRACGADLAITYLNERAQPHVRPLAEELGASLIEPCDVRKSHEIESLFGKIGERWGRLDFLLHSIAYAPKEDLNARVVDCSEGGFLMAMNVSCHSFIRLARHAEPLMKDGGCLLTMTFYGSERVVEQYNLMGPVKAALESVVRYLAGELGEQGIRVHAISPGPVRTRAASGIDRFDELLERARAESPEGRLVGLDDIGAVAAFLVSDQAAKLTGNVEYVDAGLHITGLQVPD